MKPLRFILQRKILIGLLSTLIVLVGVYAMMKLDKELLPPFSLDGGFVQVEAGDLPAAEVERSITTPLEQQLERIEGIKEISSTTYPGRSSIQLTFDRGKGEDAIADVESMANQATASVRQVEHIEAGQYGTTQSYQFFLDISGGEMEEMTAFAKNILEPRLEELPEVGDVDVSGGLEQEMVIHFDREEIDKKGLQINEILPILQQSNEKTTLGELTQEKNTPSLRWTTSIESVKDVENISIPTSSGFILLQDIATVSLQPQDHSSFVWKNGAKDFIFAQIGGVSEATDIETAAAVRAELQAIENERLLNGFVVNEIVAQADYVKDSINGVSSNILIGGLISIIILMVFLRNSRATIIIGTSIPTSILLTLAAMWLFDYSLNILTLIGLGLGIGMMVDSSIVILESIYHKKEQGLEGIEAVLDGIKDVATAVIASVLTTIVVFLPIGLLGGEMGQFMIVLSVVVAITLISSVIVSFTLVPSLAENFLQVRSHNHTHADGPILLFYHRLVTWTVRKKRNSLVVIALFMTMFTSSLFLITKIPMTIMPDVFNRYTELMVNVEDGLSPKDKQNLVEAMDSKLANVQDVESRYMMDNGDMFYTVINMTKEDKITREQTEVNEDIFQVLRELEDSHPVENVQSVMEVGGGHPVQVNIKGESFPTLQALSVDLKSDLQKIEGIVGINTSMDRTSEEKVIELKKGAFEDAGLNENQIRQSIEQTFLDEPITELKIEEENVPLRAVWKDPTVSESSLLDLAIPTVKGDQKLSNFVELNTVETPNEISHADGERFISITADIEGRDLGAINRDVQRVIDDFESPTGYTVAVAGDLETQRELILEMIVIFGTAIFLVYLVMAVQFNHLFHPLIVMSVIPMTVVGVVLGLFLTQRELSVMSAMGIVLLIGIVLNNAILFITRTNQRRRTGMAIDQSLVQAGKDRIRPIFMTSLTTAGGMLPLALATGSAGNYQAPMATVIISGLLFATVITLFLIPAVYRLFSKSKKEMVDQADSVVKESAG